MGLRVGLGGAIALLAQCCVFVGGTPAYAAASGPLYSCQVVSAAAAAAEPPPTPSRALNPTAIAEDHFSPLCPEGEVPYPVPDGGVGEKRLPPIDRGEAGSGGSIETGPIRATTSRHSRSRRSRHGGRARVARVFYSPYWYSYALADKTPAYGGVNDIWDEQENEQPYVAAAYSHSLSQLWGADEYSRGNYSTIEMGWTEAPGQYPDVETHLFVAMSDCDAYEGNPPGYVGNGTIPWVQVSSTAYPNMDISHSGKHFYEVKLKEGNWWANYDGNWLGYIPHSAWSCVFPRPNYLEWGGEVATPEEVTCTDMGNGHTGTESSAAKVFYTYWVNEHFGKPGFFSGAYFSDISKYNAGSWYPSLESGESDSFRYGGPGWC